MKTLSEKQIVAVVSDARRAFEAQPPEALAALREELAREAAEGGDPFACAAAISKTRLFEAFRRRGVAEAMRGKTASLREVPNAAFLRVRAHFIRFFDAGAADRLEARIEADKRARLLWRIEKVCAAARGGVMRYPDYPAAICRTQYACALEDASAEELTRILITVTARARAREKK